MSPRRIFGEASKRGGDASPAIPDPSAPAAGLAAAFGDAATLDQGNRRELRHREPAILLPSFSAPFPRVSAGVSALDDGTAVLTGVFAVQATPPSRRSAKGVMTRPAAPNPAPSGSSASPSTARPGGWPTRRRSRGERQGFKGCATQPQRCPMGGCALANCVESDIVYTSFCCILSKTGVCL